MAERKKGRGQRVRTVEADRGPPIEANSERAIRMRHGLRFPADAPLPNKAEGNAELMEKLRAIELRALEKSGRLAELRAEVDADVEGEATKSKIIDRLKGDD